MAEKKDDDKGKKTTKARKKGSAYKLADDVEEGQEAAPEVADAEVEDNVVDLDEAREAQAADGSGLFDSLGDGVKAAVRDYLVENVVPDGQTSGNVAVDFDANFLKTHGPKIFTSVVQNLFKQIVPEKVEVDLPIEGDEEEPAEAAEGEAKATETASDGDVKVSVNLDLANFFKGFFTQPSQTSAAAETTAADDDSGEDDE